MAIKIPGLDKLKRKRIENPKTTTTPQAPERISESIQPQIILRSTPLAPPVFNTNITEDDITLVIPVGELFGIQSDTTGDDERLSPEQILELNSSEIQQIIKAKSEPQHESESEHQQEPKPQLTQTTSDKILYEQTINIDQIPQEGIHFSINYPIQYLNKLRAQQKFCKIFIDNGNVYIESDNNLPWHDKYGTIIYKTSKQNSLNTKVKHYLNENESITIFNQQERKKTTILNTGTEIIITTRTIPKIQKPHIHQNNRFVLGDYSY